MTTNDIQSIINRFLAAETTIEEERQLALELQSRADASGIDALPGDWQAVMLMLGELTLGEAAYDEIIAARGAEGQTTTLSPATAASSSTKDSNARKRHLWRWAAVAAVLALVAGAGIAFYQLQESPQPVAQVFPTGGKQSSHQWEEPFPPVGNPDTSSSESQLDQSQQSAQLVASTSTPIRKKHARRKAKAAQRPLEAEAPSATVPDGFPSGTPSPASSPNYPPDSYAEIEAEMRDIRSRGERIEAMVAELTRPY